MKRVNSKGLFDMITGSGASRARARCATVSRTRVSRTRVSRSRVCTGAIILAGLVVLAACSGDGRPFEEAVEVQTLNLASLEVIPPERTTNDPYFAVGQIVDFRVRGTSTSGGAVELSAVDRQWRVSDSSVATIDDNGRLVGRSASNAAIAVDLVIGGIVSESYSFNISDAALQSILPIDGAAALDPCLPMPYSAMGMFSDSTRPLYDVEWTIAPAQSVGIVGAEQGVIEINGIGPGDVELTASSAGVVSEPKAITINQTLNAISVTPRNLGLQVGGTRDMVATGNYMDGVTTITGPPSIGTGDDSGTTPDDESEAGTETATETGTNDQDGTVTANDLVITDNVNWATSDGSGSATISNDAGTRGQLEATAAGTVTVSASCGAITGSATLTVSESSTTTTSSNGLGFVADEIDESGQLVLSLSNDANGVRVRLEDSDGDDVTAQADWRLSSTTSNNTTDSGPVLLVGNSAADKGLITPLLLDNQDVRVEYDGTVAILTVLVVR